jgi:UDP-N-acetylmuramoyl-L-alanyl-D-glutamate--2,6-diaminopimelate ligase
LATAKEFTKGKLYCLVGCGGDRDRTKRPIMARIARTYADYAVFTSDNPRTEDPQSILNDMIQGMEDGKDYESIIDRKQAIERCIALAQNGDCVVIAGKGHEMYQIIQDQVLDFDDREVASFAIRNRIK